MNCFFNENRSEETALKIYEQRVKDAIIIYEKFKDNFIERDCPYCDANEFSFEEKFLGKYEVVSCLKCNSLYIRMVPDNEALFYYYNNCDCNLMLDDLFRERSKLGEKNVVNKGKLKKVLEILDKCLKKDKKEINILEIGCGSGKFLDLLWNNKNEKQIKCYGIDLDGNALSKNENKELDLRLGGAETFVHEKKFDLIIHFELIEHIINPSRMMGNIYLHLEKGGYCFFSTPNSLGLEIKAIHYNKIRFLAHSIFPPMHINAFNTQNITHFLLRNNFCVKEIETPGVFDVSILLNTMKYETLEEFFSKMKEMEDKYFVFIQKLICFLNGSSHMTCLVQKS
jgi:2-polyprenyl-6-hydroxyphenyl methylase / 3-demethylubiquinone-9 3-methyltransferase